ncbi:hypothetical protein NE237_019291 [Protea cynaroides]|uniref:photosystem I n=1 Tax=Protea cynaroides TaxID=273540 RepID=A0A9Q0KBJ2_9MAGN|nr:hypothetical protein NE237_019291 [Protea cynaroides]
MIFTGIHLTARLSRKVGVVLAVLTASFGVTGYSLPWDQIGYWAVKIVTGVPEAIPVIGSNTAIQLQPVFAQWIKNTHALAPGATAPGATTSTSLTWGGGDLVAVGGKVALLPIPLETADFLVHHIHAFTIHVTVLILLKGVLFARSSRLIPDKANLGFRFPCDGPGRGGTCQVSTWDQLCPGWCPKQARVTVNSHILFHGSSPEQSEATLLSEPCACQWILRRTGYRPAKLCRAVVCGHYWAHGFSAPYFKWATALLV